MAYCVFISCVSSEFGGVRTILAKDFRDIHTGQGLDILPRVQENPRPNAKADTVLRDLSERIRTCDAVICIHGVQSGWIPPTPTVQNAYRRLLPPGAENASATQWEYYFAKSFRKPTYVFRAGRALMAAADPPIASDDPVVQQQFNDHVEKVHGHLFYPIDDLADLRVLVMQIDWRGEHSARLVTLWRRIATFLFIGLFANLISLASNAGTVLDLIPIFAKGPKPAIQYYVTNDSTHGLVMVLRDKKMSQALSISGNGAADLLQISPYDVWTITNPLDYHVKIKLPLPDGRSASGGQKDWAINFTPTGPCIPFTGGCYYLTKTGDHRGSNSFISNWTGPREADLGRTSLSSRYDDLVAQGDMLGVLGGVGFSALIAAMIGEIILVGRVFSGAIAWTVGRLGSVQGFGFGRWLRGRDDHGLGHAR